MIDQPLLGLANIDDQSLDSILEQDRLSDRVAKFSPKAHEYGN